MSTSFCDGMCPCDATGMCASCERKNRRDDDRRIASTDYGAWIEVECTQMCGWKAESQVSSEAVRHFKATGHETAVKRHSSIHYHGRAALEGAPHDLSADHPNVDVRPVRPPIVDRVVRAVSASQARPALDPGSQSPRPLDATLGRAGQGVTASAKGLAAFGTSSVHGTIVTHPVNSRYIRSTP